MAKFLHNDVFDGAFNIIKNNCTTMMVCSDQPTTRAEAISLSLADVAMAPADFTLADDVDGRKMVTAAKTGVPVDAGGAPTYVGMIDATRLLLVDTCSGPVLTVGSTVTFPEWKYNLKDPT